jgi:hypothetical protein
MHQDGNLRRGATALYAVLNEGREVTVRQVPGAVTPGSLGFEAEARDPAQPSKVKPRTGRGNTLSEALLDLAKKAGVPLPPAEG